MKSIKYVAIIIGLTFLLGCRITKVDTNNMQTKNYVPDKETAIRIAEAIWVPIYGEKIYNQKPYIVTLVDSSIWVVTGTLPENKRGGVAYIEIQKNDCKILKVTHGK